MKLNSYNSFGIINRTPNSFSDQGKSLDDSFFKLQLQSFLDDPSVVIDIGFESTAPMNKKISAAEEKERFDTFLEASKNFSFQNRWVSFDTYKVSNFLYMTSQFKKRHPYANFIFNDVSGILDEELKSALLSFKGGSFFYIYTFSHIPSRELVLDHQNFLKEEEDVISSALTFFKKAHSWFLEIGMEDQLIMDPGFGFSKSYSQNWELVERFSELEAGLCELNFKNSLLLGLSKKSFLKKKLGIFELDEIENLQLQCIKKIKLQSKRHLLFRLHDPSSLHKV